MISDFKKCTADVLLNEFFYEAQQRACTKKAVKKIQEKITKIKKKNNNIKFEMTHEHLLL